MQLEVKTILNRIQRFAGFVYQDIRFRCRLPGRLRIEVAIESHRNVRAKCGQCLQTAPTYDHLPQRRWLYVPLWGIKTLLVYAPRRVQCPAAGVVVGELPL